MYRIKLFMDLHILVVNQEIPSPSFQVFSKKFSQKVSKDFTWPLSIAFIASIVKSKFAERTFSLPLKRSETETSKASDSFARIAGDGNLLAHSICDKNGMDISACSASSAWEICWIVLKVWYCVQDYPWSLSPSFLTFPYWYRHCF